MLEGGSDALLELGEVALDRREVEIGQDRGGRLPLEQELKAGPDQLLYRAAPAVAEQLLLAHPHPVAVRGPG